MIKEKSIRIPENLYEWLKEYAESGRLKIDEALIKLLQPYYWVWEAGKLAVSSEKSKTEVKLILVYDTRIEMKNISIESSYVVIPLDDKITIDYRKEIRKYKGYSAIYVGKEGINKEVIIIDKDTIYRSKVYKNGIIHIPRSITERYRKAHVYVGNKRIYIILLE